MSARVTRLGMWWDNAFWVIPLTGVLAAVGVDSLVDAADEAFADSSAELASLSPSAAVRCWLRSVVEWSPSPDLCSRSCC